VRYWAHAREEGKEKEKRTRACQFAFNCGFLCHEGLHLPLEVEHLLLLALEKQ
jgi:hypothetical protein